jgi:glycosyltransferase involved in cell wall biosynthesis
MNIVFFNPYADSDVKGAARRIFFLKSLLDGGEIPTRIVLRDDYARARKGILEKLALCCGLRRLGYFLHACALSSEVGTIVISEVIFTPTWRRSFILTIHDLKAFDTKASRGGALRRWSYLWFARLASNLVVVSQSVKNDLQKHCQVLPDKIHVIPNGISRDRVQRARQSHSQVKQFDFIYVSSFASHKRFEMLVRVAPAGARLCLVGRDLGSLASVQEAVRERGTEISVAIRLDVDTDEELFRLMGTSRCGVFPSVFEGFGIPLLEYCAVGLYVMASDIPPFLELAQYVDRFIRADDAVAWSKAMEEFLASNPLPKPGMAEEVERGAFGEEAIGLKLHQLLRGAAEKIRPEDRAGSVQ